MSSHASLDAAAQQRKNRLAQLKSLKRKQPESTTELQSEDPQHAVSNNEPKDTSEKDTDVTSKYLSGRNYDAETRGPKLGFENAPTGGGPTLEEKAAATERETREQAAEKEQADKPLDLFDLQPKKPNWDLKRDLQKKMDVLNVRTDNAIAKLVRERIQAAQRAKAQAGNGENGGAGDSVQNGGELDGARLVEATRVREREDEEDEKREQELEAMDL